MAIESNFIREPGPFVGSSCLPWRQRGEGVRSPMAVNVDFTRGTIRPRLGAAKFYENPDNTIPMRVMGLSGYRKANGESLVVAVVLLEQEIGGTDYPWKLEFQVFDTGGTRLSNVRIDQHPLAETADPDNWYDFTQFNQKLYITSKIGRSMVYNYAEDKTSPKYAEAFVDPSFTSISQYSTFPQGAISTEHDGHLVVAGFDGETGHSLNTPLALSQNILAKELTDPARSIVTASERMLLISEIQDPDLFAVDRSVQFPGGGAIVGLASTQSGVLVLSEENVSLVQVLPPQEEGQSNLFSSRTIAEGIGCVSQRSVCQGIGITAWLSYDGIYSFNGESITKISDDIEDLWSTGRWQETPMTDLGETLSDLGYPFVIQKSRMDRACGIFDAASKTFIWALPLAGHSDYNRLVITFYPTTGSWSISAPMKTATNTSSFRPTNFASVHDRGRKRILFSDYNTGIYANNESTYDYQYRTPGTGTQDVDVSWVYQGPAHDMGPGTVSSPKALQLRNRATGDTNPASWHIETERNFDMPDGELGSTGSMHTSPSSAPPTSDSNVDHYWDATGSRWGVAKWHRGDVWRSRYPVGPVNGNAFRVGFSGEHGTHRPEIFDYAIEVDPKRDVT